MKKLLIALTLMLSIPVAALAVDAPAPAKEESAAQSKVCKRAEWMAKELGLNAEQKSKVEDILKQQKEKRKALREEIRTQLEAVLTPEQVTKMKAKHDEMKAQHKKHHDSGED